MKPSDPIVVTATVVAAIIAMATASYVFEQLEERAEPAPVTKPDMIYVRGRTAVGEGYYSEGYYKPPRFGVDPTKPCIITVNPGGVGLRFSHNTQWYDAVATEQVSFEFDIPNENWTSMELNERLQHFEQYEDIIVQATPPPHQEYRVSITNCYIVSVGR